MGMRFATAILLVVALVSISDGREESPQPLEPVGAEKLHPGNKALLQEFHDHAEYKRQSSGGEDVTEHDPAIELPEHLPTSVAMKLSEPDAEVIASARKLSVPKKGVAYEKPSVVPKKEVHFTSSVVAKKGADPESSTPSVSPRKGVELSQGSPNLLPESLGYDLLTVSSERMDNTNVTVLSSDDKNHTNTQMNTNGIGNQAESEKGNPSNIPTPQLVQEKGKSNDALFPVEWNTPQPLSDFNTTLMAGILSESVKVSNTGHFKPTTADDPSTSSSQVSYVPIFMITALVVLVIIVVAVGYRRLKDTWARRHYNYVDFLVDGMYE